MAMLKTTISKLLLLTIISCLSNTILARISPQQNTLDRSLLISTNYIETSIEKKMSGCELCYKTNKCYRAIFDRPGHFCGMNQVDGITKYYCCADTTVCGQGTMLNLCLASDPVNEITAGPTPSDPKSTESMNGPTTTSPPIFNPADFPKPTVSLPTTTTKVKSPDNTHSSLSSDGSDILDSRLPGSIESSSSKENLSSGKNSSLSTEESVSNVVIMEYKLILLAITFSLFA